MEDEKKQDLDNESKHEEGNVSQLADSTPMPKKTFSTKIAVIAASAVAVVGIGAVALFGILGGGENSHTHSFGEWATIKEATCEINGAKERFCTCGEKQIDEIIASGHTFGAWTIVEESTCATEGSEKRECSCGEKETRLIDKHLSHDDVIVDDRVEPTCKDIGLTEGKHCTVCGETIIEQEIIDKLTTHTYKNRYDADCEICGYVRVPDCPHSSTGEIPGKDPSCTEGGFSDGTKCNTCGNVLVPREPIDPTGHKKSDWIIEKEATCTSEGRQYKKCTVCNERLETEPISVLPHTYGSYIIDNEATCTTAGSQHKECKDCGNKSSPETIPTLGHIDSQWIVDKEATCTEKGARHKHCSRCDEDYGHEYTPAKGHTEGSPVEEGRVEATCTTDGYYYSVVYCTVTTCEAEVSSEKKTIKALGHNYVAYVCTRCTQTQSGVMFVYTREDLNNIRNDLSATYVLKNDIDCQGFSLNPIGVDESNPFTGIFDGCGNTISNYQLTGTEYYGIFGVNDGIIKNLNVKNFSLNLTTSTGKFVEIGGIVGRNSGVIEKCSAIEGDISVVISSARWAALICGASSGEIKNCYATGNIYVSQKNETRNWAFAGGITTYNEGKIENCFVDATIHAYAYDNFYSYITRGGEAGLITAVNCSSGEIINCFVMGNVKCGNNRVGNISGLNEGDIISCYYDKALIMADSKNVYTYGTELTREAMSSTDFYKIDLKWDSSIWDFTNVNLSNKVYPKLKQN